MKLSCVLPETAGALQQITTRIMTSPAGLAQTICFENVYGTSSSSSRISDSSKCAPAQLCYSNKRFLAPASAPTSG
jgi:hypothetical protein